jgi:hypothetical protein
MSCPAPCVTVTISEAAGSDLGRTAPRRALSVGDADAIACVPTPDVGFQVESVSRSESKHGRGESFSKSDSMMSSQTGSMEWPIIRAGQPGFSEAWPYRTLAHLDSCQR